MGLTSRYSECQFGVTKAHILPTSAIKVESTRLGGGALGSQSSFSNSLFSLSTLIMCVCVYVCAHECRCLWRPETSDHPKAGIRCSCELLDTGDGS